MNLHQDRHPWADFDVDNDRRPIYSDGVRGYYETADPTLLLAVEGCLDPDPQERVTVQELWDGIQDVVGAKDGMREALLAEDQVIWFQRDKYALKMT